VPQGRLAVPGEYHEQVLREKAQNNRNDGDHAAGPRQTMIMGDLTS
jgi:hypothetical protein